MMRCDNVGSLTLRKVGQWSGEEQRGRRKRGCPGAISRRFPCTGPRARQGRTVDELSTLRPGGRGGRTANLSALASTTTLVVLFGDGSREPKWNRTWGWAGGAEKLSTEPSVCGRLVGSTLVRVAHRPIHPAKTAQPGPL